MGRGPGCASPSGGCRVQNNVRPTSRAEWGGARHHPSRIILTFGVSVWLKPSGPSPSPRRRRHRRRLNSISCGFGPAVRLSGFRAANFGDHDIGDQGRWPALTMQALYRAVRLRSAFLWPIGTCARAILVHLCIVEPLDAANAGSLWSRNPHPTSPATKQRLNVFIISSIGITTDSGGSHDYDLTVQPYFLQAI